MISQKSALPRRQTLRLRDSNLATHDIILEFDQENPVARFSNIRTNIFPLLKYEFFLMIPNLILPRIDRLVIGKHFAVKMVQTEMFKGLTLEAV